ncbi:cytochrome P450 [Micromonospora sp. NPDC005298]|uniref:cytochrome P450 n=1 Tax=Micromonospora sp. NPDC005298 TaxID=3156873 RepID=UPI0033A227CD
MTGHAHVESLYRDAHALSSESGNMADTVLGGGDTAAGRMLVVSDGPRHLSLRQLLGSGFSPRGLRPVEAAITRATAIAVDRAVARGTVDFAGDVAAVIPLTAICELLAVPEKDRAEILRLTATAMSSDRSHDGGVGAKIAQGELLQYYARVAAERRSTPGDDIVSMLARADVAGGPLTDQELLLNCYNLIIGGDETARLSIATGLLALLEHPAQLTAIRRDPSLLATAVEEILRWTTPVTHVARRAVRDLTVAGRSIRRHDPVILWNVAANRDPAVFARPDAFEVARTPNRHVTFGAGRHYCLGASMARLELRLLLQTLLRRAGRIDLAGEVSWIRSNFLSGVSRLPVRMTGVQE